MHRKDNPLLVDILWDRIYLNINIKIQNKDCCDEIRAYLVNKDFDVKSEFEVKKNNDSLYTLVLNVTNSGINRCIGNGSYSIVVEDANGYNGIVIIGDDSVDLDNKSKCYRYRDNRGVYTVTFECGELNGYDILKLLFYNASVSISKKNADSIMLKIAKPLRKLVNKRFKYRNSLYKLIYKIINKFLCDSKTILFMSEQQDSIPENMEVLLNRIDERNLKKEYKILYSFRKATSVRQTTLSSIKCIYYIAISSKIFIDDHVPWFDWLIINNKTTKLIQLWHAGAGFKGVGFSRWGHYGSPGPFNCHRQYTYAISPSSKISHFFSEQFGILPEQVIPTGMPRIDRFLDPCHIKSERELLYKNLSLGTRKKNIILFAPTYRGKNRADAYYPFEVLEFDTIYKYCIETDSLFLIKSHPWVNNKAVIPEYMSECIKDISNIFPINSLFYVTDIYITDYSSGMFEYSLLKKPMLAFPFDLKQYSSERGFHRSYYDNIPGKVCHNFEELINSLYKKDFNIENNKRYLEKHFDQIDVNNSDRVIDWLILDQMPDEYKIKLEKKIARVSYNRSISFKQLID